MEAREQAMNVDTLKAVTGLAVEQIKLQNELEDLKGKVKAAAEAYREISEKEIPNLMRQVGLQGFKLETGETITIKSELYVTENVPPGKMDNIVNFLKEEQAEELLRHVVIVSWPHKEKERAEKAFEWYKMKGVDVALQNKVNVASLKALVRELQQDETVDLAPLGLYEITRSIIK